MNINTLLGPAATISDNSVTNAKLADIPSNTLIGRVTEGTGDPEYLTAEQTVDLLGVPTFNVTDTVENDILIFKSGAFTNRAQTDVTDGGNF